jgi:hypothetical protein
VTRGPRGSPARPSNAAIGLCVLAAAMALGAGLLPPMPQPAEYHQFVDRRACGWLPNCLDAGSNLLFIVSGATGLLYLWRQRHRRLFEQHGEALPYWIFFAGIVSIGFGSGYYHLDPDNHGLMLDRLAMMLAFMAWFAAIVCERAGVSHGLRLLPLLLAAGIGSVLYWGWTEAQGAGDLRPYLLMQAWPMLSIVALAWLYPPRYTRGATIVWVIALYALALVFDRNDRAVFDATSGTVSGHTIKHALSAVAVMVVVWYLARRRPVAGVPRQPTRS